MFSTFFFHILKVCTNVRPYVCEHVGEHPPRRIYIPQENLFRFHTKPGKRNLSYGLQFDETIYIFMAILMFGKPLRLTEHRPHVPGVEFTVFVPDTLERLLSGLSLLK